MRRIILTVMAFVALHAARAQNVGTQNATTINNYFNGSLSTDNGTGIFGKRSKKEERKIYRKWDKKRSSYGMGLGYRTVGTYHGGQLDVFIDNFHASVNYGRGTDVEGNDRSMVGGEMGLMLVKRLYAVAGAIQTYNDVDSYEEATDKLSFQFGLAGFIPIGKVNIAPKVFYNKDLAGIGWGVSLIF